MPKTSSTAHSPAHSPAQSATRRSGRGLKRRVDSSAAWTQAPRGLKRRVATSASITCPLDHLPVRHPRDLPDATSLTGPARSTIPATSSRRHNSATTGKAHRQGAPARRPAASRHRAVPRRSGPDASRAARGGRRAAGGASAQSATTTHQQHNHPPATQPPTQPPTPPTRPYPTPCAEDRASARESGLHVRPANFLTQDTPTDAARARRRPVTGGAFRSPLLSRTSQLTASARWARGRCWRPDTRSAVKH